MTEHVDRLEWQARQQLGRGDARGAIETLRAALSREPDDASLHALLSIALLATRRRHAARLEAETAVSLSPDAPSPHLALGYARLAFRDLRAAREAFERSAALAPEDARAQLGLGRVSAAAKRDAESRAALERALALSPEDPDIVVALGELDLRAGRRSAARDRAREALSAHPEHEDALELMGRVLLAEGRTGEAREHALWILRQDATSRGGIRLLCATKARSSPLLGLWWRWNAFMSGLAEGRSLLVLVGLYVVQRLATLALRDAGLHQGAELVSYAWLAFALYTWFGPAMFAKQLRRELAEVRLRTDF